MSRARIAIAVLLVGAIALGYSFLRKDAIADSHRQARQLVLRYTLGRVIDPIIILGDSLTEASTLPRSFCGHLVVNAGLNGASTASDLGTWLLEPLDGKRAAAIIVALGTNDALLGRSAKSFEADYSALLTELAKSSGHLVVLGIPAIEIRGNVTTEIVAGATSRIDGFNAALPALAARVGASFVPLPPMPTPHTIDGVHLDAAGYAVWDQAVLNGASAACASR